MSATAVNKAWASSIEEFRYELKCVLDPLLDKSIESWISLHPLAFTKAYPERIVNTLYFDSFDLRNYRDNLGGISERSKCRLRWYGDQYFVKKVMFEIKYKRNRKGQKYRREINLPISIKKIPLHEIAMYVQNELPEEVKEIFSETPKVTLLSRYKREYMVDRSGMFRITLDSDLQIYDQQMGLELNTDFASNSPNIIIMECKIPIGEKDAFRAMLSDLPHRLTRSSKYAIGMQAVFNH